MPFAPDGAEPLLPKPVVVSLAPDLFWSTRIADVVQRLAGDAVTVESPEAFVAAVVDRFPVLALVDLGTPGDWRTAIARCKLLPHTRHVPIYAYGSHVDTETLKAARTAGADHAWPRSKMMEDLPQIVAQHIKPATYYPEGWDDALSDKARMGLDEFNRGDYFEQHEWFEAAWLEETRPIRAMYQGILQIGVAFFLMQQGKHSGALKLFRRGLPRLRTLPDVCQGVRIGAFRRAAELIHAQVTAMQPEQLAQFDQSTFPRIDVAAVFAVETHTRTEV